MQPRRLIVALAVSILLSAIFTMWLGKRISAQHRNSKGMLQYVAPAKNINAGEVITQADLAMVSWPQDAPLRESYLRTADVVGKFALYPLQQGEPLGARQLASDAGLSGRIPAGMRAISLKSNEVVGVAGYLLPGTHVDVLVTVRASTSPDPVTSTVLQDAQVLTAGEKMQPDPDGHANRVDVVTLLVSPEDAEKVVLASTQGTVHFVLRNGVDHSVAMRAPLHMSELSVQSSLPVLSAPRTHASTALPVMAKAAHTKAADTPYSIQIRRGDKDSVETF